MQYGPEPQMILLPMTGASSLAIAGMVTSGTLAVLLSIVGICMIVVGLYRLRCGEQSDQ